MNFVQIIEFSTTREADVDALLDQWLERTRGKRTATRGVQTRDRERANTYVQIIEFPSYEDAVHEVFDAYRGNIVGLVEYQKAVPDLDLDKYQNMKVRHYRNRCREMGIAPDETLIEQILDPSIDFVVGVEAG